MKKLFKLWLVAILGVFGLTGLTFALVGGPRAAAGEDPEDETPVVEVVKADSSMMRAFIPEIKTALSCDSLVYSSLVVIDEDTMLKMMADATLLKPVQHIFAYKVMNLPWEKVANGSKDLNVKCELTINGAADEDKFPIADKCFMMPDHNGDSCFIFAPLMVTSSSVTNWEDFSGTMGSNAKDTTLFCNIKVTLYYTVTEPTSKNVDLVSFNIPVTYIFGKGTQKPFVPATAFVGEINETNFGAWKNEYRYTEVDEVIMVEAALALQLNGGFSFYDEDDNVYGQFGLKAYLAEEDVTEGLVFNEEYTAAGLDLAYLSDVEWEEDSNYVLTFVVIDTNAKADTMTLADNTTKMIYSQTFQIKGKTYPVMAMDQKAFQKLKTPYEPNIYAADTVIAQKDAKNIKFPFTIKSKDENVVRDQDFALFVTYQSDTADEDDDYVVKHLANGTDALEFDTLAAGFYTFQLSLQKWMAAKGTPKDGDFDQELFIDGDSTFVMFTVRIGEQPLPPTDTNLFVSYNGAEAALDVIVEEKTPSFDIAIGGFRMTDSHAVAVKYVVNAAEDYDFATWDDTITATKKVVEGVDSIYVVDFPAEAGLKHGDVVIAIAYFAVNDKKMIEEPANGEFNNKAMFTFKVDTIKHIYFNFVDGEGYAFPKMDEGNRYSVAVECDTPTFKFALVNTDAIFGSDSILGRAAMYVKMSMPSNLGGDRAMNVYDSVFMVPAEWHMDSSYIYEFTFELYRIDTVRADGVLDTVAVRWDTNETKQVKYVTVSYYGEGGKKSNLKTPDSVKAVYVDGFEPAVKVEWQNAAVQGYEINFTCNTCRNATPYTAQLVPESSVLTIEDGVATYYQPLVNPLDEDDVYLVPGEYYVSVRGVNWYGQVPALEIGTDDIDLTEQVNANIIKKVQTKVQVPAPGEPGYKDSIVMVDSCAAVVIPGEETLASLVIATFPISNEETDPEAVPANKTFTVEVANVELGDGKDAMIQVEWGLAGQAGTRYERRITDSKSFTIDSTLKEGNVYFIEFTLVQASDSVTPIMVHGSAVSEVAYFYTGKKPATLVHPKAFYVGATSFRTSKPEFEFFVRDTVLSDSVKLVVMYGQDTSSVFGVNKYNWNRDTVTTAKHVINTALADGDYLLWAYLIAGKKAPYTVISDTMKLSTGFSIATNTILTVAVAGSDRTFGPDSIATFNHAKPSFKLTLDGAKFGANEAWVQVKYGLNEDDMETVLVKTPDAINYDGCSNAEDSTAAEADYALYGAYNATFTVAEPLADGRYTIEFRVMKNGKVDSLAQHVYPCYFNIATVRPDVVVERFNGTLSIGGGEEVEYTYPDSVNISGEFEYDYSNLTLLVQVKGVQVGEVEGAPEFHAIGPNVDEDGNVIPGEPEIDGGFFPDLDFGGFGDDQFFYDGEGRPFDVHVHATLTKGTDTLEVELTPAAFGEGLFQLTADELYTAIERGWNEEMPGIGTWKVAYTVNYDSLPCLVKNLTLYGKIERDSLTSIYVQGFAKGEQQAHLARGFEDTVKMNIVPMNVDGVIGTNYAINLKVMNPQNWQKPEVIDTIIKTNVINPFKFVVPDGYYTFSVTLLEPATGNQWEIMKDQDDQDIVFNSCFRMGLHCPDIENGEAGVLVDGYDATFVWAGVEGQYYEIIVAGDTAIVRADERIMNEEGMYTTGTATMEVGTYNFKIRGVKLAASFDNIMYIEIDSALMIVKATDWAEGEFAVETIVPYAKPEGARVSETYAQTTIAPSMMFEGVIDTTYNYGALFRWDESESNVEIEIYDTLGNLKDRLFSWGPEAREYLWNTKNPADSGKWFMWRIRTVDAEGEYDEEAEKTIYTVKEYNASEWDTVGRFQLVNWRNPNELVLNSAALMVYFGEEGIDYCEDCDLQTVRGGKRPTFSYIVSDVENELGEGSGIYFSIEDEDGDGEAIEEKTIRPIQTEGTITVGKDLVKNYGYIVNVWLVNANGDYYRGYYTGAMFTYVVEDEAFVEMPELKGVNVYPNPAAGQFNVTVPANGNVTIFNANGQVIARENNVEGVRSYNLRNSGIYFVRVIANGQAAVKRVVIR